MKLKAATRNKLPNSSFALPAQRKFPVPDESHARNALARAGNKGPAVKAAVKKKVKAKFPGIQVSGA